MVTDERPILLSVHPRFAEAILEGHKTVELRRQRVTAAPGTLLVLYATTPTMAVIGTTRLADTDTDTPTRIWQRHREGLALNRHEYDTYLHHAQLACALLLTEPVRLTTPLTLDELRMQHPFHPPQSYRYLASTDPARLHDLVSFT